MKCGLSSLRQFKKKNYKKKYHNYLYVKTNSYLAQKNKMNIQEKLSNHTGNSRRIQGGSTVTTPGNGMSVNALGMSISSSLSKSQSNQPASGSNSVFFTNKPSHPFEFLDPLGKAKLIKEFLIERGVTKLNAETARALFLVSTDLIHTKEISEEDKMKYPKKKLKL